METCYFAKEPPEIELRGGLVFIVGAGREIAVAPATLAAFVAKANRALDEIYEHRRAGVVPIRTA